MALGGRAMWTAGLIGVAACAPPSPDPEPAGPASAATPRPATTGTSTRPPSAVGEPAGPATLPRGGFECRGDDPAWTLRLEDGLGELVLPDRTVSLAGELEATPTGAWTWLGLPDGDPDRSFALLVVPGWCFPADGSAALPYSGELGFDDGRRGSGCCRPIDPD